MTTPDNNNQATILKDSYKLWADHPNNSHTFTMFVRARDYEEEGK